MGYVKVPVLRGFTEIRTFFDIASENESYLCGGYARYCASPRRADRVRPAGDVDFFPKDEKRTETLLRDLQEMGFEKKHENDISITLRPKKDAEGIGHMPTPQIIKPVIEGKVVTMGTIEEILDNFDFSVVRAAIYSAVMVIVDEHFMEDELHLRLRILNIHCPVSSLLRCCKYAKKGYWLPPSEALKLFNDWMDRDDDYRLRLLALFKRSEGGEKSEDNPDGMTEEEINELEALLRID